MELMKRIRKIRSGGQTGVDRAALDAARQCGLKICGWCPKGGWAVDCPEPPGLLAPAAAAAAPRLHGAARPNGPTLRGPTLRGLTLRELTLRGLTALQGRLSLPGPD